MIGGRLSELAASISILKNAYSHLHGQNVDTTDAQFILLDARCDVMDEYLPLRYPEQYKDERPVSG